MARQALRIGLQARPAPFPRTWPCLSIALCSKGFLVPDCRTGGRTTPPARRERLQGGQVGTANRLPVSEPIGPATLAKPISKKYLKKFEARNMKLRFVAFAFLVCLSSGIAHAEDCPIPKTQPDANGFVPPPEDYPSVSECRDLTDRSKNGGKPLTLMQLEELRRKNSRADTVDAALQAAMMGKKIDCMIASGDIKTCTCLVDAMPVFVSYLTYVHIVTNPEGSDFSYLKLNPQDLSKLTGIAWSVRDMCIVGK